MLESVAMPPPGDLPTQEPGQRIKRQRERLQCHGRYEGAVYFPAALSIQLCANISLSSSPQGIQAAGFHQRFIYSLVIIVQRGPPEDWTAGAETLFEEQERETQRALNSPSRATP